MDTPILCSPSNAGIVSNATRFSGIMGNGSVSSGANPRVPITEAGAFSKLVVRLGAALTGSSQTLVVTVMKNNVDTALTVTFNTGDQVKADTTHSFDVAAGDDVQIKWVASATAGVANDVQCALVFTGTTASKSILSAGHAATSAATFLAVGSTPLNATETNIIVVAPCDGVIDRIRARRTTAPGAGQSVTYTLRLGASGGAMSNTGLASTISDTNTAGTEGTTSVSVAAGDFLSIGVTVSGTPASSAGNVGLSWTPTIEGEALLFAAANSGASSSANRFIFPNGQVAQATESDAYGIAPMAFTARKLYGRVTTAPASGKSWTTDLMIAGAAQSLTAAVADANTTFTPDTTNSVSVANQNLIDLRIRPAGTPTAYGALGTGMVAFTGVEGGGGGRLLLMGVG